MQKRGPEGELWIGIKPECGQSTPYTYVYNDAACTKIFRDFSEELRKPYEKCDRVAFVEQCCGVETREQHHDIMNFLREKGCYIVSPAKTGGILCCL